MRVLGRVFEGRLREIRANLVVQCRLHLLQPCYCGKDQTIGELIWQTLTRMGHWTLQSSENSCLMNSTTTNNGKNMLLLLQNPAQGRFRAFSWVWSGGNWAPNFASSSLQGSGHFFLSAGEKVASERTENRRGSSMDVKRRLFLASGSLKCSPGGRQEEAWSVTFFNYCIVLFYCRFRNPELGLSWWPGLWRHI